MGTVLLRGSPFMSRLLRKEFTKLHGKKNLKHNEENTLEEYLIEALMRPQGVVLALQQMAAF